MAFPDDVVTLPDPATRTETDGLTLRQKLTALLSPYKAEIEGIRQKLGWNGSSEATSVDYKLTRAREQLAVFSHSGIPTVGAGTSRYRFPFPVEILGVTAAVNTAPTGASLILDVNKNGTTIFTNQVNRPTIAASAFATTTEPTPNVTTIASGDYLTVDRDQIGSTVAGSDITVFIRYRRT